MNQRILVESGQSVDIPLLHLQRQGIESIRAIERHDADSIANLEEDGGVGHGTPCRDRDGRPRAGQTNG